MDDNLHSPQRQLIELRVEHADLNALSERIPPAPRADDLSLRRLKKRRLLLRDQRLLLRDQISRLQVQLDPPEPA